MEKNTRIILALDVMEKDRAIAVAKSVAGHVDAIKVNYPIVLSCGMEIISELSSIAPIICDFKIADIPNTDRLIIENVRAHNADGVIVHGFTGPESMKACVEAASGIDVFVVTEMSHPGAPEFFEPVSTRIIEMAKAEGATGIIAPATRPERVRHLRELIGTDMLILSPGVGAQGGSGKAALEAGADYIIVGRSIYNAENPAAAAEEIRKTLL